MDNFTATEQAYKNGYEQGMKDAVKWISIHERMPKILTKVLAINKYGEMMVGTYTEWGWIFPSYFEYITHWMQLPEPPKEIGYA